eukprot:scaffold276258_cov25-Prasinocladus_malaysianus.AAC.1
MRFSEAPSRPSTVPSFFGRPGHVGKPRGGLNATKLAHVACTERADWEVCAGPAEEVSPYAFEVARAYRHGYDLVIIANVCKDYNVIMLMPNNKGKSTGIAYNCAWTDAHRNDSVHSDFDFELNGLTGEPESLQPQRPSAGGRRCLPDPPCPAARDPQALFGRQQLGRHHVLSPTGRPGWDTPN